MVHHDLQFPLRLRFFSFLIFIITITAVKSQNLHFPINFEIKIKDQPLEKGSEIKIFAHENTYSIATDEKGTASILLSPGKYQVEIWKNGILGHSGKISVTKAETFTLPFSGENQYH